MKTAFARQMALTTALILLTLLFLSGALSLTVARYLGSERRQSLSDNAQAIAALTSAYSSADELESSWDFRMSMSLASHVSGTDAVICDPAGHVLVCACEELACTHLGAELDDSLLSSVYLEGETYLTGRLDGLYAERRYIHALLLTGQSGDARGIVVVSVPTADVSGYLRRIFRIFVYTAVVVVLIAIGATYLLSRSGTQPMRELTETVRRFGHGDLSARARTDRHNTTEMNALAAAFNNMAGELTESERRRQEFVANVSHELKTPMTSIAGYMDGMLDGTIPAELHPQYMQIVADEVRRLGRLVRNMLDLSRMQSEGMDRSRLSRFELADAVGQVLLSFEQKIEAKHIEVQADFPEKPLYVSALRDGITQVVYNLIDNAVKFCSDCGYLTVTVRQEGSKAHVSVENTGPVIPAEELPLIFDRFHKLDRSRSRDPDGAGLGLYIVKTIIGAHGEDIWVESHDGKTVFTFTLTTVK